MIHDHLIENSFASAAVLYEFSNIGNIFFTLQFYAFSYEIEQKTIFSGNLIENWHWAVWLCEPVIAKWR